jgi:hypothetical protein
MESAKSKFARTRVRDPIPPMLACGWSRRSGRWQMTAVSAFLLKAKGAYRSPDERGFTFMILTDVRWAQ